MITAQTVFPFTFVPTRIAINNEHVDITYRQLVGTSQTETVAIRHIHFIEVDSDWFFSTLIIVHGLQEKRIEIPYFRKADAKLIKDEIENMQEKLGLD